MRIEWEQRRITCSVGDLVQGGQRRVGLERGDGFRRMWIGQEIHSRRAETQSSGDPNYRPEVAVTHRFEAGGWTLIVAGRIDGLSFDQKNRRVLIEEVKSLHFALELAALYRSEKLHRHLFQLMLYAYFLSHDPKYAGCEFLPQLVLIDVVSGSTRTVDAPFERDDVESAFEASALRLIESIEVEAALRAAKRAAADELAFPHDRLRPFQQQMIDAVEQAVSHRETLLVSAPTGVGKTIAALYPAVKECLRRGKKLFFLTPKTLQQETAVAALESINDGTFRVLRIRAKQRMCANDQMICHEDYCPYAARYGEKMQRNGLVDRIATDSSYFDPDLLFEMAKSEEVCPFEVSLELVEQADVVICDYNYIFDPYVGLKAYQQENDYGDCVLIIDEAHNLLDRGRGYYSPELHEKAFVEIRHFLLARSAPLEGWEELIDELREHFAELAMALEPTFGSLEGDGDRAFASQALCEPDRRLLLRQRAEWEQLIVAYITWKIENRIADEDDPLVDFYFKLMKFTNLMQEDGDQFAHLIEKTADGLRLKIFCKDPSRFLGEVIDSSYATVAMSATLEPFEFFRQTLGFPPDRTAELSLPSPFPRENRKIVVVPSVNTTWKERANHFQSIADTIAQIAGSADGNFLALFPSYVFLQEVSARLSRVDKTVLVQRTEMTEYERRSFLEALRRGAEEHLILGVSGGMYAEGIDYRGDMLSGVFVVGPALPTVSFEQELLKRYYDEQYGAGFEYAYLIPGMTRVVQSAGRVIRSESDIGMIALLCKRFTYEQYTRYFPADWYEKTPRELVSKKPVDEVRAFFEARRSPQLRLV
jgi:DNA excision repair protein ERCC-2